MKKEKIEIKAWSTYKQIIIEIAEMYEEKDNWVDKKEYDLRLDRQLTRKILLETLLDIPHA